MGPIASIVLSTGCQSMAMAQETRPPQAQRGDGAAIDRIGRDHLHREQGQAWLRGGEQRLQELRPAVHAPPAEPQREPAALAR